MKIFISSTFDDLKEHRAAVHDAIMRLRDHPVDMQDFGSQTEAAGVATLKELTECDFLVGIYAHRYGTILRGQTLSITEQEYNSARKLSIPCLCYFVDPTYEWPDEFKDKGKQALRLASFLHKIERRSLRSTFTTPDNLAWKVVADLCRERAREPRDLVYVSLGGEFLNLTKETEQLFVDWVAKKYHIDPGQVQIMEITRGSLHVLLELPQDAAKRLVNASTDERLKDAQFGIQLVEVVQRNISSGRFERMTSARSKGHPLTNAEYVDRVIEYLDRERVRLLALERGDPAEWNRLYEFLYHRALRLVHQFRSGTPVEAAAKDFAQEACIVVFEERYPCDVPFEAWVTTILNHLVLAGYTRSKDMLDRSQAPDSLDAPLHLDEGRDDSIGDLTGDPRSLEPFEKVGNQDMFRKAIAQLRSSEQREVIIALYFEGLDEAEIARRLKKSRQAVYNLHSRALARLKQLLAKG